ncbi:hypothetical protein [Asticcacaulis sp. AND118]|uniref:hypothetical protein n=1 Tax=Asticcacaulis sp. AND118 TaxID=2840468 RepID=UPI001CFFE028|nr:hypothetical protein [Asticcacaulis sp. AND118]UDF04823.1 hypothetical protein LH365_13270 [Asticcacaulis sp. AND118]
MEQGMGTRRRMTLVTGADHTHGDSLLQFLSSALQHESRSQIIAYDLGLRPDQRAKILALTPAVELRSFDYEHHPAWFDIRSEAGQYAWKPTIIASLFTEARGPVVWMDSGNLILCPLDALYDAVVRNGFYSPRSSGTLADWTHPSALAFFGLDKAWAEGKENVNGACVAFDPAHEAGRGLCLEWARLARVRSAIAPRGSSRANHRQDQALLGVLAHRDGLWAGTLHEYAGFVIHRDVENLFSGQAQHLQRVYQLSTYANARRFSDANGFQKIVNFGAGSGDNLMRLFDNHNTIGYEIEPYLSYLRKTYPDRIWRDGSHFDRTIVDCDMIICCDMLEYAEKPEDVLAFFARSNLKAISFTVPALELLASRNLSRLEGAPLNTDILHEWTTPEFRRLIGSIFEIVAHGIVDLPNCLQMVVAKKPGTNLIVPKEMLCEMYK